MERNNSLRTIARQELTGMKDAGSKKKGSLGLSYKVLIEFSEMDQKNSKN